MDDILLCFSLKYDGDFEKVYTALKTKETIDSTDMIKYKNQVRHKYITIANHYYPNFLKSINCPPIVLFYKGNLKLIDKDLPIEYSTLENGKRFISTVDIINQNGKMIFDYVVGAESQEDLEMLIEHIKNKGIPLKDYDKSKKRQMER